MKIRVLIVDDEQLARRNIRRLLSKHDVGSIAECGDGESAVMAIRETKADIVFLDVQMPVMDGFQVIKEVGSQVMPVTVFVTAYDRYALRAFDTNAIDYLLKPVGKDRFERALTRAKERLLNSNPGEIERIISSLERINTIQRYSSRLAIPMKQRIVYVTAKDIDWIQGEGNYVRLHIGKSEYELRETLAGLAEKLNPAQFVRIHRSTIVNIQRVKEVQPWFNGHHLVLLENGTELRMSRYQHEAAKRLGLL